ncbi:MAG: hypothetical protein ACNYWU_11585 [Desulfobacterales bacterium]
MHQIAITLPLQVLVMPGIVVGLLRVRLQHCGYHPQRSRCRSVPRFG